MRVCIGSVVTYGGNRSGLRLFPAAHNEESTCRRKTPSRASS